MSIPPQVTGSASSGRVMEDCRDYLRTGRCKYGGSCKYNHPPNVQTGGGLKPLDPSEPLFPSRANEPICQYYLKHGTCKFGQACKFDHPPQHMMHVVAVGGQVQFMNMGHLNNEAPSASQMMLNSVGPDTNGMVVQFLPQRTDEPDCIYFLKNGRCKYGATCRYHHPVPPQGPRRVVDTKPRQRQPDQYTRNGHSVQYVTQMYPNYVSSRSLQSYDNNPVTFVSTEGNNGSVHSYQIVTGSDGVTSYCVPTTGSAVPTEPRSSASSIASSYDQDHFNDQWNRARRNGSGNSLNGVYTNDGKPQRVFLSQSSSEGNIIPRQSRSTSYGSASEINPSSLPRNTTSSGTWNQRSQPIPYSSRPDVNAVTTDPNHFQRHLIRRRDPRRGDGHDEGFTMMTSALLNMLDTPEEAICENLSDDEYFYNGTAAHNVHINGLDDELFQRMSIQDQSENCNDELHGNDGNASYVDRTSFEQVLSKANYFLSDKSCPSEETRTAETGQSWSPTWLGAVDGPPETGYTFSLLPPTGPPTQSQDSDVGLYFP
jgi:Zinc finger C-x8-C-x5-C-x3-H type (and similar)